MSGENYLKPAFETRIRAKNSGFSRPDESMPARTLIKSMLLPGEEILQTGKISMGIYWKSFAVLFLSVVTLLFLAVYGLPARLWIFLLVVLTLKVIVMFVIANLTKHYLLLAVTNKRVMVRFGILNLEIAQLAFSKIESSEVASTLPGRFFGYSSVFVSGTGGHVLAVPYVINAMDIRKLITEIVSRRDEIEVPGGDDISVEQAVQTNI